MSWLISIPFFWVAICAYVPIIMAFRDQWDEWTGQEVRGALFFQFIGNGFLAGGIAALIIFW